MIKKKKLKGKTEKECSERLRVFMVEYDKNANQVSDGIIELLKVKFSPNTIRLWLKHIKTITMNTWDEIRLYIEHIESVTKN